MGVPAFFRWLSRKYPSVIVNCLEEKPKDVDGVQIPVNSAEPNPNGVEFDNLYLDMNGIIHPCTHPEDKPAPKNEDEMMVAIFECIDRLFRIVRPRKILYMAIDGVAPRAKMNQQRSRRFRAAKETTEKIFEIDRIRKEMASKGILLPPEKEKGAHFDSNCITPGTPFMARLSDCLHYYIHQRMNYDPGWHKIKVILSDANVPGEGEHKIMDFIRRQRAHPDHDPNTQHCLCGADADLIMLGLATHEPNFTIIREEFKPNKPRPCDICGQLGHEMKECLGLARDGPTDMPESIASEPEFIFVRLNVLREYLERELQMPNLPFKYDFERAVDDWVFMCFFVGNDFLPHLPSLEIREGAIDRLVGLYKKAVYKTGGFVTESGLVNLDRVQLIMSDLGEMEDEIFKVRQQTELMFKEKNRVRKRREKMAKMNERPRFMAEGQFAPKPVGSQMAPIQNARQEALQMRQLGMQRATEFYQGRGGRGRGGGGNNYNNGGQRGQKRSFESVGDDSDEEPETPDEVRLWEEGFKDRYYESKFDVTKENIKFRHNVALQYVRGLCWVLRYYYQGCASWKWYFPYHYAPFASDFVNIAELSTDFEKNTLPFQPLEQLMGVFPAASSSHVPLPFAKLMSDPDSPIIDFYPEDFKIDLNGKKFAWQGVALLPFVDETRLRRALDPFYRLLTPEEKRRNQLGSDRLYLGNRHPYYSFLVGLAKNKLNFQMKTNISCDGVCGTVMLSEDCVHQSGSLPSPVVGLPVVRSNTVTVVRFADPRYGENYLFKAVRLPGAKEPPRVLKPKDLSDMESKNWRPQTGMVPSTQRATLGAAGHQMMSHYQPKPPGVYSSVPTPSSLTGGGGGSRDSGGWSQYGASRDRGVGGGNYGGGTGRSQSPFRPQSGGGGGGGGGRGGYGGQDRDNRGRDRPQNWNEFRSWNSDRDRDDDRRSDRDSYQDRDRNVNMDFNRNAGRGSGGGSSLSYSGRGGGFDSGYGSGGSRGGSNFNRGGSSDFDRGSSNFSRGGSSDFNRGGSSSFNRGGSSDFNRNSGYDNSRFDSGGSNRNLPQSGYGSGGVGYDNRNQTNSFSSNLGGGTGSSYSGYGTGSNWSVSNRR